MCNVIIRMSKVEFGIVRFLSGADERERESVGRIDVRAWEMENMRIKWFFCMEFYCL